MKTYALYYKSTKLTKPVKTRKEVFKQYVLMSRCFLNLEVREVHDETEITPAAQQV